MRTNYYAVVLSNGYLMNVFTDRADAEERAGWINGGDFNGPEYETYSADVVRGLSNIKSKARRNFTVEQIKRMAFTN
jgi:hypothetical protein